jgi:hypothetical protein
MARDFCDDAEEQAADVPDGVWRVLGDIHAGAAAGRRQGMQNGIETEFGRFAVNSLWVWSGKTSMPYAGLKPGREISFRDEDLAQLARQVEGVQLMSPRNWLQASLRSATRTRTAPSRSWAWAPTTSASTSSTW